MHNNNDGEGEGGSATKRYSTYLLQDRSDVLQRQWRKLILLQEVIQVLFEHFEHQTCVILVLEAFECPHKVELIGVLLAETREDRHLDLALARVRRVIFEDLDGDDVARALLPALHHLAECSATQELENLKRERSGF